MSFIRFFLKKKKKEQLAAAEHIFRAPATCRIVVSSR